PLAVRPVKHFDKCRDPCPGKALMKPGSRIESADLLETEIGCEAMAIGRSLDREVMQNDRLAVRGQHDVDLDHRGAPGFRRLESRKRVLWVVEAVAPVTADLDAPGLAGKKLKGICDLVPVVCARNGRRRRPARFWPFAR